MQSRDKLYRNKRGKIETVIEKETYTFEGTSLVKRIVWNRYISYIVNSFIDTYNESLCYFKRSIVNDSQKCCLSAIFFAFIDGLLKYSRSKGNRQIEFFKRSFLCFLKVSWVRKCISSFILWCVPWMFYDFKFWNKFWYCENIIWLKDTYTINPIYH